MYERYCVSEESTTACWERKVIQAHIPVEEYGQSNVDYNRPGYKEHLQVGTTPYQPVV